MTNSNPGMNNMVGGGNMARVGQGMSHPTSNIQGNLNSMNSLSANIQVMSGGGGVNTHAMNQMGGNMASGLSGNMTPPGPQSQGGQPGFNTTLFKNSSQMMQNHGMFSQTMQNQGSGIQNQGLQNQGMNMQNQNVGFQNLGIAMQNQNTPTNYNVLNTHQTSMVVGMNQFGNQNMQQQPSNMMNQPQSNTGMMYNPNMVQNSTQQQTSMNPNVGQNNNQQHNAMNTNYHPQGFQGRSNNSNFNSGGYGNR
jgi:hypothetical protein